MNVLGVDLSIIMPVFNEQATVVEAVKRTLDADLGAARWELVIVDDGSSDNTPALLEDLAASDDRVRIVTLTGNGGKGRAVREGAAAAIGSHVAVLDADLEYDPNDFGRMLPPVLEDGMDAALSTRHWQAHSAFGFWYVMGNRLINLFANILYNSYVSDLASCLKVVRRDLFLQFDLRQNGFDFDAEVVGNLLRRKARVYEVPVSYMARTREEGKKIKPSDGVRYLWVLLKCRVRPLKAES